MSIKRKTNGTGPSVAILSGQLGQVSSGMAKRSLAMEIPEYDLPTSAGVYKQLYACNISLEKILAMFVIPAEAGIQLSGRRYLHDHLYSPAAIVYLTASNCILVERSEYDAYGAAHYYNADYSQTFAVSQHGNPFAFTGREIDSFDFASGVPQLIKMHYRHRDYSPVMGRFYQQDPAQYIGGLNLYEYVKSRPVIYVDNLGLFSIDVIGTPTFKRNHCLNGKPDGTGCVSEFWMSVALRPTPEEMGELLIWNNGTTVLRKFARWKQYDCESGLVLDGVKSEEATFVRALEYHKHKNEPFITGAASKGWVSISEMTNPDSDTPVAKQAYISPYYSALIAKKLNEPVSTCCSKGKITVIAEFFLYGGTPAVNTKDYRDEYPRKTISWPEYIHIAWAKYERISDVDSLATGERISSGTLRVDIEWDCKNNVKATSTPTLLFPGNLTRTGREGDWDTNRKALKAGSLFQIPFN